MTDIVFDPMAARIVMCAVTFGIMIGIYMKVRPND